MNDLHPQHALIIAYADGHADATERLQAVQLIETDAEAAEFYRSLQVTAALPYADACLKPAPQSLIEKIAGAKLPDDSVAGSVVAFDATVGVDAVVSTCDVADSGFAVESVSDSSRDSATPEKGFGLLALAASLFCGLIAGAAIYGTASSLGSNEDTATQVATTAAATTATETTTETVNANTATIMDLTQAGVPEWVRLVADYHRLYIRETITATPPTSARVVSQQVSESLQHTISIPSLQEQGMEFRRAQWLAIDEQPLLQLAYLPDQGDPLAVCILKKNTSVERPAEYGTTGGMRYVHWQSGKHAVVVVGTVSEELLRDINGVVEQELL